MRHSQQWPQLEQYYRDRLVTLHNRLEIAEQPTQIYRIQGQIEEARNFLSLAQVSERVIEDRRQQ